MNQPYNYQQPTTVARPPAYGTGNWAQRVRPVASLEEVKASPIDFDGSVFFFPDFANKRIYTKFITVDGTAAINMYELKEIPQAQDVNANYITREEFEQVIQQLRTSLVSPTTGQGIKEEVAPPAQNFSPLQF